MKETHISILDSIENNEPLTVSDSNIQPLNELLITPGHTYHKLIAKVLQDFKSPSTVSFVRTALESRFDYLAYTGSESDAIAKWFSWLLVAIGTEEAISLIREYSDCEDEGISREMLYRLGRI